jgi:hypothetical protein
MRAIYARLSLQAMLDAFIIDREAARKSEAAGYYHHKKDPPVTQEART